MKNQKREQENVGGRNGFIDHTGKKFGLLTAIERTQKTIKQGNGRLERQWILTCICGSKVTRTRQNMVNKSKTCGSGECLKKWKIEKAITKP